MAQWAGVPVPDGVAEASVRASIRSPPAFQRGTVAAISDAARSGEGAASALTGSRFVQVGERDGGAKKLAVATYTVQTPDPAATNRRIQAQTPAWLTATHVLISGWTVGELEAATSTVSALEAGFASVLAVETNLPI